MPGWSSSTTMPRAATSSDVERLVEVEDRLQAAIVLAGERGPLVARALAEHRARPRRRPPSRGARTASRSGRDARRRRTSSARTSAPARRATPTCRPWSRRGSSRRCRPPARARRGCGHRSARRSSAPTTIASHDSAPSVIEMSTIWPSPERSRSMQRREDPDRRHQPAAAEVGDLAGRLDRRPAAAPGEPEQAVRARGSWCRGPERARQRAVLPVAGDRAVDRAAGCARAAPRSRRRGGPSRPGRKLSTSDVVVLDQAQQHLAARARA